MNGATSRGAPPPAAEVPAHLVALAQSGVGVALASASRDGRPALGLGLGCRVRPGGVFRVLADRGVAAAVLDAVSGGGAVAVTFTATRNHASFQVKARHPRVCAPSSDDVPEIDRQLALFRDGLMELGFSAEQAAGYSAHDPASLVAIEFVPEKVFSQTPGPGAGTELTR